MKLLYSKENLTCQWFGDDDNPDGFTGKTPPHAGAVFDEETGEWAAKTEGAEDGKRTENAD